MENRPNLRKIALLAGAALLSTGAMTMPIDERTVTQTEIVRYSEVESTTPEGAKKLYRKLQAAAERVCTDKYPARGFIPQSSCISDALGKAIADVASPQLSAIYLRKHPDSKLVAAKQESSTEGGTLASR